MESAASSDDPVSRYAAVPHELRERRQWLVWRLEPGKPGTGGKPRKTPYTPGTVRKARSTDPDTWRSYGEAIAALATGQWCGIGYVFSPEDPYCGIDLDHCRNPETGAIAPWAQRIIDWFATYTEVSPSSTGVKLWLKAQKPVGRSKTPVADGEQGAAIEVYDRGRYFTVTGQRLASAPTTIAGQQARLDEQQARLDDWYSLLFPQAQAGAQAHGRHQGKSQNKSQDGPRTRQYTAQRSTFSQGGPDGQGGGEADAGAEAVPLSDDDLVAQAMRSANGPKFARLWAGDDTDVSGDASRGDLTLCRLLAFWTAKDTARIDRLFRDSARFTQPDRAAKWDRVHFAHGQTYGEATIAHAIASQDGVYTPGSRGKRDDRRTLQHYPWQQVAEAEFDRRKRRSQLSASIVERVRAHLDAANGVLLTVTAPPGSGKSTRVAELGMARDLAYIAERHDVADSIDSLPYFHHLHAPTAATCPFYEAHERFAAESFDTLPWHQRHRCEYARQFGRAGSTVYMVEHVPTPYPGRHRGGIVVDEMSLTKWLPERKFTAVDLRAARLATATGTPEAQLLQALDDALLDAERAAGKMPYPPPLHGRALLDALNQHCGGHLRALVEQLAMNPNLLNPRRMLTAEQAARPETITPHVLPHVLRALEWELVRWQHATGEDLPKKGEEERDSEREGTGDRAQQEQAEQAEEQDWNGLLRLARVPAPTTPGQKRHRHPKKVWALGITARRRFHRDASPARALLDATANVEALRLLFDMPVDVAPAETPPPPPHMRHLHLSVRYSLTSMRARQSRDRNRALAQARYLLRELNPDGSKRVALITYLDCVEDFGEALGIPPELRGWFWAERGSNKKADAEILLVIGSPTLPPDEVARLARALYANDPAPINTQSQEADGGGRHFLDPRMQRLSEALTDAELTQCAHRNRPLWHDGRVVVTFCQGTIDHLPITEHIQALPQLDAEGERVDTQREAERAERCRSALLQFLRHQKLWPTRAQMRKATGLGQDYVSRWMREEADAVVDHFFAEEDERAAHEASETNDAEEVQEEEKGA